MCPSILFFSSFVISSGPPFISRSINSGYYGNDTIYYQVNWLKCARDFHGIDVDYLGLWNERPWGTAEYVKSLKRAIEAEGMRTRLVLGDGAMPDIWTPFASDADFVSSFAGVGLHYPCEADRLES